MLNKLREKNINLINKYSEIGGEKLIKQKIIQKLLENDNCFLKLSIEEAYSVLKDLNVNSKELKKVYLILTNNEQVG